MFNYGMHDPRSASQRFRNLNNMNWILKIGLLRIGKLDDNSFVNCVTQLFFLCKYDRHLFCLYCVLSSPEFLFPLRPSSTFSNQFLVHPFQLFPSSSLSPILTSLHPVSPPATFSSLFHFLFFPLILIFILLFSFVSFLLISFHFFSLASSYFLFFPFIFFLFLSIKRSRIIRYLKHLNLQRSMLCVELAVLKGSSKGGGNNGKVKAKKGTLAHRKSLFFYISLIHFILCYLI